VPSRSRVWASSPSMNWNPRASECRVCDPRICRRWPTTKSPRPNVTELDGWTTKFHEVKNAPRAAIAGRSGETRTIPDLITDTQPVSRSGGQADDEVSKSHPEFTRATAAPVSSWTAGSGGGEAQHHHLLQTAVAVTKPSEPIGFLSEWCARQGSRATLSSSLLQPATGCAPISEIGLSAR